MAKSPSFTADSRWLDELLLRLPSGRVAVFGDLFLDAYWMLDTAPSEKSVETGLDAYRVRTQRYSPGGGGNVAVNVAALGVRHVELIGLAGADLFGDELLRQFVTRGVPVDGVLRGPPGWQSLVYAKPYLGATELNRFDFGLGNRAPADIERLLLGRLDAASSSCPVVIINQQAPGGWPPSMIAELKALIGRHPDTLFIVDSRDHADSFRDAALKLNLREAARILGENTDTLEPDEAWRGRATRSASAPPCACHPGRAWPRARSEGRALRHPGNRFARAHRSGRGRGHGASRAGSCIRGRCIATRGGRASESGGRHHDSPRSDDQRRHPSRAPRRGPCTGLPVRPPTRCATPPGPVSARERLKT